MTIKPLRLPITSLRYGQCKYPVTPDNAAKHLFCALPVESAGCVYCATHAALCYDRRPEAVKRAARAKAMVMLAARKQQVTPGNVGVATGKARPHQSEAFGRDS